MQYIKHTKMYNCTTNVCVGSWIPCASMRQYLDPCLKGFFCSVWREGILQTFLEDSNFHSIYLDIPWKLVSNVVKFKVSHIVPLMVLCQLDITVSRHFPPPWVTNSPFPCCTSMSGAEWTHNALEVAICC